MSGGPVGAEQALAFVGGPWPRPSPPQDFLLADYTASKLCLGRGGSGLPACPSGGSGTVLLGENGVPPTALTPPFNTSAQTARVAKVLLSPPPPPPFSWLADALAA